MSTNTKEMNYLNVNLTEQELAFLDGFTLILEFIGAAIYDRSNPDILYPLSCLHESPRPCTQTSTLIYRVVLTDGRKGVIILGECDREEY